MNIFPNKIISDTMKKDAIATSLVNYLKKEGFDVAEINFEKPWGGYIRMADENIEKFIKKFFHGISLPPLSKDVSMSPKLLIVEPYKLLSWQVHERRAEFWRVLRGPVGAYRSESDEHPKEYEIFEIEETIDIPLGIRHRLVGKEKFGIVSEIWIHTDPNNPSNEEDIRRIADDFGRS